MRARRGSRAALAGLLALWIAVLVLGFVSQTTELFGAHDGALALLLLALAGAGFVLIGGVGMSLIYRALDEHPSKPGGDV